MVIPSRRNKGTLLLIVQSQRYLMVPLKSIQKAYPMVTNDGIHQLVYLRYHERIFRTSFVQIYEIHTHTLLPTLLLYHDHVDQPFTVEHLFYNSHLFKLDHLFFDSLGMFFRGTSQWLFLRGNRGVNVQMVTNEVWIHPKSLISALSKNVNILLKKGDQLFLLLWR